MLQVKPRLHLLDKKQRHRCTDHSETEAAQLKQTIVNVTSVEILRKALIHVNN